MEPFNLNGAAKQAPTHSSQFCNETLPPGDATKLNSVRFCGDSLGESLRLRTVEEADPLGVLRRRIQCSRCSHWNRRRRVLNDAKRINGPILGVFKAPDLASDLVPMPHLRISTFWWFEKRRWGYGSFGEVKKARVFGWRRKRWRGRHWRRSLWTHCRITACCSALASSRWL